MRVLGRCTRTFLRVLLDDTLHNHAGRARVKTHLRHFLSFRSRGNTRLEILLNKSSALHTLGVGFLYWEFLDVSHATTETAEVSVSGRRPHQHNRGEQQDGDSHADRRSDIVETHARIVSPSMPQAKGPQNNHAVKRLAAQKNPEYQLGCNATLYQFARGGLAKHFHTRSALISMSIVPWHAPLKISVCIVPDSDPSDWGV